MCLFVRRASQGRAGGPARGATGQAKKQREKEQFIADLHFVVGGAGAAWAAHRGGCEGAASAASRVEYALLRGTHQCHHPPPHGWHVVCRSPAWPRCSSTAGPSLGLTSASGLQRFESLSILGAHDNGSCWLEPVCWDQARHRGEPQLRTAGSPRCPQKADRTFM